MKIAVTGATGYIGQRFIKSALAEGHEVVALTRLRPHFEMSAWIDYDLTSGQSPSLPTNIDVVVHLAAFTSPEMEQQGAQEEFAAQLLIKAAQDSHAKFIFISSQAAREDAPTEYGRIKWRIEQHVLAGGGVIVRPGMVYGANTCGLFGVLVKAVERLPLLPEFLPPPRVQPIHVDDLALALLRIATHAEVCSGMLFLGSHEPVSFSLFLRAIARDRLRRCRIFVPVPTFAISAASRLAGRGTSLKRLPSLFTLPMMDTASSLERIGLKLRPMSSGMHASGNCRRRSLLFEGQTLLSYVLIAKPDNAVLRRYIRAIEKLRDGAPMPLQSVFIRWPVLLALVDGPNNVESEWQKEFLWRLNAATVLAEATCAGARRFLGAGDAKGVFRAFFGIAAALSTEAFWRVVVVLLAPFTRLFLRGLLRARQ